MSILYLSIKTGLAIKKRSIEYIIYLSLQQKFLDSILVLWASIPICLRPPLQSGNEDLKHLDLASLLNGVREQNICDSVQSTA